MKYLSLILAGLRRRPVRTILTGLSCTIAFLLFGLMHGVTASWEDAIEGLSETRIHVTSRANRFESLPLAHGARIATVDGVLAVVPIEVLGSYYQELSQSFAFSGTDIVNFLPMYPEIVIDDDQLQRLLANRTGAMIGAKIAETYGWKIGDQIPLKSFVWTNSDGSDNWSFEIVAIHNTGPGDDEIFADRGYFHFDYLDEARQQTTGTTARFIAGVDQRRNVDRIMQEIDEVFANSSDETRSLNEKQFFDASLREIGDLNLFVNSILGAVLFTLLFLTGSTMIQSVRERIPELGVLKSLGFSDSTVFTLVLAESLVLSLLAACVGLALAGFLFPSVFKGMGVPSFPMPFHVYAVGVAIAVTLATVVAIWPALKARRLSIPEAISGR